MRLIAGVLELYPDFTFDPKDVTVLIDTPTQAFAEYVSHPTAAATGRRVHHLLMGRIVVENGEINLLREALNTVATAQALLPGGVRGFERRTASATARGAARRPELSGIRD